MDLKKLFEMQGVLDERIEKEHPPLEQDYRFNDKLLALLVEIGELANETRCFKFWSNKGPSEKQVILEEFVDGVHFFISQAIELGIEPEEFDVNGDLTEDTTTDTFLRLFAEVSSVFVLCDVNLPASISDEDIKTTLHDAFTVYVGLAEKHLDFNWDEDVVKAYMQKNQINHERQDNSY